MKLLKTFNDVLGCKNKPSEMQTCLYLNPLLKECEANFLF